MTTAETITLFHATTHESALNIAKDGFHDGTNSEGEKGVWFSSPAVKNLLSSGHPDADTIIEVDIPIEIARRALQDHNARISPALLAVFPKSDFREYLLPAQDVNRYKCTFRMRPI